MTQPPTTPIRLGAPTSLAPDGDVTLYQFAKMLPGVNPLTIKKDLMRLKFLFKRGARYMVYAKHQGLLFAHAINETTGTHDIFALAQGRSVLMQLYLDRSLTMKAASRTF